MRSFLLLVAMAAVAMPAAAQRPRSDSLPRELVIALLGGSLGGSRVDVQAGMADDSLPADVFRDALVLGFADYRFVRTTVANFPYSPQATIDTIKARFIAAGWTATAEEPDTVRGFVTAYGGTRPLALCRGRAVVVPTVVVRTINRTTAVISSQGSQGVDFYCGRGAERRAGRMNGAADTPLPPLPPPVGMVMRSSGTGGSPSPERPMTMEASLEGALPLGELIAHYAGLFTKAGWSKTDQVISGVIAVATFEITAKNQRWSCSFVISIPTDAAADVHLTLRML